MNRTGTLALLSLAFSGYISQQIERVIEVSYTVDNPDNVILFKFTFCVQGVYSFDERRETKQLGWEDIHKYEHLIAFIIEESKPIIDWLSTVDK